MSGRQEPALPAVPALFARRLPAVLDGLGTVVLRHGLDDALLLLGLDDCDGVRKRLLGTRLALWVGTAHDLDLDS